LRCRSCLNLRIKILRDWLNQANRLSLLNKFIGLTFIGFGVSIALSELKP